MNRYDGSYPPRLIRSHPLLGLIPALALRRLLARATLDEVPKGGVMARAGEACSAVWLLLSGRCEALEGGPIYAPGEAIGVRELLNREPYTTTIVVRTHAVFLRIPAPELEQLFTSRPAVEGRFAASLRAMKFEHEPPGRRVVSLLSLGDPALAHTEAHALAAASRELRSKVLLLEAEPAHADTFPVSGWYDLASRCNGLNGEFCLSRWMRDAEGGYHVVPLGLEGRGEERGQLTSLLSHAGKHFDLVLLQLPAALLAGGTRETLLEGIAQGDLALLFTPHQESGECQALLRDLRRLPDGQVRVVEAPNSLSLRRRAQLAREICRQRIGIALSSGGAKGLAHIGVFQVLEENGIELDAIAGSSMGAYVGAFRAFGCDGATMERVAREVEGRWGWLNLIDPVFPPSRGISRVNRAAERLREVVGNITFDRLAIPLRVIATELAGMNGVELSDGEVTTAVEASIAIPGICEPVRIGRADYLDGGISDPLPVGALQRMGVERVIAVNTIPTPAQMRHFVAGVPPPDGSGFFSRYFNAFAQGNLFDTLLRSTDGMQMQIAGLACQSADVALSAALPDGSWHDFGNPAKYIAHGRAVAEACLPALLELTKGNRHESRPEQSMAPPLA